MASIKTCRKCKQNFPATLEFFYKNSGGKYGVTPRCKTCVDEDNKASHAKRLAREPERVRAQANARSKKSYQKDLEKSRTRQRDFQAKRRTCPDTKAKINMAKRAGGARLTQEEYDNLLASQHNSCAICETTDPGSKLGWNVDHCHKSNKVRWILCAHCNRGLGAFRDNPTFMRRAADMLETFE